MVNELLLLSGNDVPFIEAQTIIHQPTVSEISMIGEESFWSGCQFLNFSKSILKDEDKIGLEDKSDFEIFMSIMCNSEVAEYKNNSKMVLTLMFPTSQMKFENNEILLLNEKGLTRINDTNFDAFKNILVSIFDIDKSSVDGGYNPASKRAEKIAEKLQKAKNRKAQQNGEKQKVAILSRYVSILAVGESKDMNELMQYTVFQLKDEFKRYQMKQSFDMYIQAKMASAQDLEEVDNWMDDIHS